MKKLILLIMTVIVSLPSWGLVFTFKPAIIGANVNEQKGILTVTVKHSGGCGKHNYSLKINECEESYPVHCYAEIFDTTEDYCEAMIIRDAVFTFKELGVNNDYFNGAGLTIRGGRDYINGEMITTQVTVEFPWKK